MRSLRIGWSETGALFTIETTGFERFDHFRLTNPDRVVFDLVGTTHALPDTDFSGVEGAGIRAIRTSQFSASTVRIVVDLDRPVPYRAARSGSEVRVTLDFGGTPFPTWSTDPGATEPTAREPRAREPDTEDAHCRPERRS